MMRLSAGVIVCLTGVFRLTDVFRIWLTVTKAGGYRRMWKGVPQSIYMTVACD